MTELLLQTIIEKLEVLEIAFFKNNAPDIDAAIMKGINEQFKKLRSEPEFFSPDFKSINENIMELGKRLGDINFRSQQPMQTHIEHLHHLHKGIGFLRVC